MRYEEDIKQQAETEISLFDENGKPKTKSTVLIEIGSQYELFHDETGDGYVTIDRDGHKETWPIKSKVFSELLADKYFLLSEVGVSRNIVSDATDTLRGKARNHGSEQKVYRRTAAIGGKIYIDLCDTDWRVVEISSKSWRVTGNTGIKFLRSPSSISLPFPVTSKNIEKMWPLLNVRPEDRPLVYGFLTRALHPEPPYFVLCVVGEQGTGKSTFARMVRGLCDPSSSMLRPPPKDDRDFLAGAINNWCITYDNLSGIQPWLSDSLCRILTGGSFSARKLYTSTEEETIPLGRPVILNGIDDLTARPDLADRAIVINLQPISDEARQRERTLWKNYDSIKGELFGSLLNGVVSALKNMSNDNEHGGPRMIDAVDWVEAAESGLGVAPGSFRSSYYYNQQEMVQISLEASPFIAAILDMVNEQGAWDGSPTGLLAMLPEYARDEDAVRSKAWPKSPSWVTKVMRRHAPALRKINIKVELTRDKTGGHIHIAKSKLTVMAVRPEISVPYIQKNIKTDVSVQDRKNTVNTVNNIERQNNPDDTDSNDGNKPIMSASSGDEWETIQ